MAEILFNKMGYPLMCQGDGFFMTIENKATDAIKKRDILSVRDRTKDKWVYYDGMKVMAWGENNDFPQLAADIVASTSVLNTGLKFLRQLTIGQGLYPCKVVGFDAKGNEIIEPVGDSNIDAAVSSRMVRRYLEKVSRDYFKFGCGFVLLTPNAEGKIIALQPINALYVRLTEPNIHGECKAIVSGCWPGAPGTNGDKPMVYDVLRDFDAESHLEILKASGRTSKPIMCVVRDSWGSDDIYSEPVWMPAYRLGWVDVAHMVPTFLKHAYENQVSWKWHVQIPYSYWEHKFPAEDSRYDTPEKRQAEVNKVINEIEANLCGAENGEKPLFTHYSTNEQGKVEEEWKITALDNKYKGGENLVTSAAANSEILFSLMVNPNVLGAMPSGSYGSNQGGSNIREAFLVNIANAWLDRQNLKDPIDMLIADADVQLRFRNTILTTLDTGAGTTKTIS